MIRKFSYLLYFIFSLHTFGQEFNLEEKFVLPVEIKETSGLIFFNGKLITHNDSGDNPNLYEIDTLSGTISRTITISNATHIDWEDISQDDTHIYIADIGNNNGDREDLTIYKILKSDYISSTNVTAEEITYNYEDQSDFTTQPNQSNFDAEAIAIYQDQILIFTKNWLDFKTNAYVIPSSSGNYSAQKISSYDSEGLITGVSYNSNTDGFLFCGYSNTLIPFLIYVSQNRPPTLDIFGGDTSRIELVDPIFLEQGSQIEGITFFEDSKYFISREFLSVEIGGVTIEYPQKLFEFNNGLDNLLSLNDDELFHSIDVAPNPIDDFFTVIQNNTSLKVNSIRLFSILGKEYSLKFKDDHIHLNNIPKGIYFLKIEFNQGKYIMKKIIKK